MKSKTIEKPNKTMSSQDEDVLTQRTEEEKIRAGRRKELCLAVPKVELHAHLLGCVRQSSLREKLQIMHRHEDEEMVNGLMKRSRIPPGGIDFERTPTQQMEMFDIARSAFNSPEDKKRIALEYVQDCAKENVVYLELRTSGSDQEKFDSVFAAFEEAKHQQLPIVTRMISSVQRSWSFKQAEQSIRLAVQNQTRGVVAVDLCGDPTSGDFRPFQSLFQVVSSLSH